MAENGYYDPYGGVDGGMMGAMEHYRGTGGFEHHAGQKLLPGFYTEQYSSASAEHSSHMNNVVDSMATMPSHHDYNNSMNTMATASAHMAGMYETPTNYALKPEPRQSMPPTPPGSPEDDDPKDMRMNTGSSSTTSAQMAMAASSIAAQHMLAKPVPMRRLSEKRIAQARASVTTSTQPPPEPSPPQQQMVPDQSMDVSLGPSPAVAHALSMTRQTPRRPRSEKKPIPEDLKDNKYFERRKRNNNAAKKSRDSRKAREDEIAIRASFLEKENAILRAQVATLREEANSLRHLLLQKRSQQT